MIYMPFLTWSTCPIYSRQKEVRAEHHRVDKCGFTAIPVVMTVGSRIPNHLISRFSLRRTAHQDFNDILPSLTMSKYIASRHSSSHSDTCRAKASLPAGRCGIYPRNTKTSYSMRGTSLKKSPLTKRSYDGGHCMSYIPGSYLNPTPNLKLHQLRAQGQFRAESQPPTHITPLSCSVADLHMANMNNANKNICGTVRTCVRTN